MDRIDKRGLHFMPHSLVAPDKQGPADTDTKYNQYPSFETKILCNISQIATGVPYSESPRKMRNLD
jgi:hypothetical protein